MARPWPPEDLQKRTLLRRGWISLAARGALAALLSGCGTSGTLPDDVVSESGEFHGRDVTLEGRAENYRRLASFGVFAYVLVGDADSVLVLDPKDSLSSADLLGAIIQVDGRVHARYNVDGRQRVVLLRGMDE